MAIYSPEIHFSKDDKELLSLLAHLILSSTNEKVRGNISPHHVVLSDSEATRLLCLMKQFVCSKKFVEGSYLIEGVFNRSPALNDGILRNIYLSWKKRNGRSRAMATAQWGGFLARLGIRQINPSNPWHRSPIYQMSFSHFLKMEHKLASSADINPAVSSIIIKFIAQQEKFVNSVRPGEIRIENNQISNLPNRLIADISSDSIKNGLQKPLSINQIIGITVIVMDFSAIFTTRDWDVSGFISTVAGAAPAVCLD